MRGESNLALKLALRETRVETGEASHRRLFTTVPPRLQFQIESILDAERTLLGCIVLGFSADGDHLISYTSAPVAASGGHEGYWLQLWSFEPPAPCRLLWSCPLFRAQDALAGLADEEDGFSALALTIAETPDRGLLLVHGRAVDSLSATSTNYLTVLPGFKHAATAARMRVAHVSYLSTCPYSAFLPQELLVALPVAFGPGAFAVGCDQGDRLAFLWAGVGSGGVAPLSQPPEPEAPREGEQTPQEERRRRLQEEFAAAVDPPSPPPWWGNEEAGDADSSPEASPEPAPAGQVDSMSEEAMVEAWSLRYATLQRNSTAACGARVAPGTSPPPAAAEVWLGSPRQGMDAEEWVCAALHQRQYKARSLDDYGMGIILPLTLRGSCGILTLVLYKTQGSSVPGSPPRPPFAECMLLHASAETGCARLLSACPPLALCQPRSRGGPLHVAPSYIVLSHALIQEWLAGERQSIAHVLWTLALVVGQDARQRAATAPVHVLSNKSVVGDGTSLQHFVHPRLPIALLGYRRAGRAASVEPD